MGGGGGIGFGGADNTSKSAPPIPGIEFVEWAVRGGMGGGMGFGGANPFAPSGGIRDMAGGGGGRSFGGANKQKGKPENLGHNNAVKFERKLGRGAFGKVYRAKYKGLTVACKTTRNRTGFPRNEIALLREMQSEHVAVLIGEEHRTPKGDVIVMKMYRGSLEDEIKGRGLSQKRFLKYLEQVCCGLHFLHMRDVIFNDLKPDNLLMEPDSDKLVLADFGDARRYDSSMRRPKGDPHTLRWGDPHYHCRPDVRSQVLSPKSDMWMLAQMAWHMWKGEKPPTNPCRLSRNIPLRGFLKKCLSEKPGDRPSSASMLGAIRQSIRELPESVLHKSQTLYVVHM